MRVSRNEMTGSGFVIQKTPSGEPRLGSAVDSSLEVGGKSEIIGS